jgi:hypothetical protein
LPLCGPGGLAPWKGGACLLETLTHTPFLWSRCMEYCLGSAICCPPSLVQMNFPSLSLGVAHRCAPVVMTPASPCEGITGLGCHPSLLPSGARGLACSICLRKALPAVFVSRYWMRSRGRLSWADAPTWCPTGARADVGTCLLLPSSPPTKRMMLMTSGVSLR